VINAQNFRAICASMRSQDQPSQDRHRVVAIDGPAASGKSSVSRELARRLGFVYVNSGAMYRAVTWHVLQRGVDPGDVAGVARLAELARITCVVQNDESHLSIDDVDPAEHLRDDSVNHGVAAVSRVAKVREILVVKMRDCARDHDLVMEGRDIGSVVFPDTPFKFYLNASPEVRLKRRALQGERDAIAQRDHADSSRPASPLVVAKDADEIDTSDLGIPEVIEEIIRRLKLKGIALDSRP
jgi:cytidylate kinase